MPSMITNRLSRVVCQVYNLPELVSRPPSSRTTPSRGWRPAWQDTFSGRVRLLPRSTWRPDSSLHDLAAKVIEQRHEERADYREDLSTVVCFRLQPGAPRERTHLRGPHRF